MSKYDSETIISDRKAWKNLLLTVLVLIIILILVFYLILPFNIVSFTTYVNHNNFSVANFEEDIQFYHNMRYFDSNISYKIHDCTIQKKNNMLDAFNILENLTILNFYSVNKNEEISVFCQEQGKIDDVLFVAGEGGPTNITNLDNFALINNARILLIKKSDCLRPNIALHELLHTLGFKHSRNPNNLMFNITNCDQTIGNEIPDFIDELYSFPNEPDLFFLNISAEIKDEYLETKFLIKNKGFKDSKKSRIDLYANDELVWDYDLEPLQKGSGLSISIKKIKIPREEIMYLNYHIVSPFKEINKDNNLVVLNKTHSHLSYTSVLDEDL